MKMQLWYPTAGLIGAPPADACGFAGRGNYRRRLAKRTTGT